MTAAAHLAHDALLELLRARAGLVFPPSRREVADAAIRRAMHDAGMADAEDYRRLVSRDRAALDALVAEATVGETYFFRDPEQWEVVRRAVREVMERRGPAHTLRAWSAACSTGEEAYTLAIVCRELGVRASILATDISAPRLAVARAARYGRWSLRGVPEETVAAWFTRRGADYELLPAVRQGVELRALNLAGDDYPSHGSGIREMDLVFCRNVLIYFDRPTVECVSRRLVASLAPGGWLFPGASDPSVSDHAECEVLLTSSGLVYRAPLPPAARSPAGRITISDLPLRVSAADPSQPPAPSSTASATDFESLETGRNGRQGDHRNGARPLDDGGSAAAPIEIPSVEEVERLYAARDYARVEAAARARIARGEGDARTWEALVRSLANRGALEEAGAAVGEALDRHRLSAALFHLQALLAAQDERWAETAAAARQALYLDPGLAVAHLLLATAATRLGSADAARRALLSAERLLSALPPAEPVAASDGETAGHLLRGVRAQLALLPGGRA